MFTSATADCTALSVTILSRFVFLSQADIRSKCASSGEAWNNPRVNVLRRWLWHSTVENTTKMMIYFTSLYFIAYEEWQATGQKILQGNLNGHNEGEPCFNMSLKWFCILQQSGELQSELIRDQYPSWQWPPDGNLSTAWHIFAFMETNTNNSIIRLWIRVWAL